MNYEEGEVYFFVTYPDRAMCYPTIKTLVFVGKDVAEEGGEEVWCFQHADSYTKFGSIFESERGDRVAVVMTKNELNEMRDLESLYLVLKAAAARREPKKKP